MCHKPSTIICCNRCRNETGLRQEGQLEPCRDALSGHPGAHCPPNGTPYPCEGRVNIRIRDCPTCDPIGDDQEILRAYRARQLEMANGFLSQERLQGQDGVRQMEGFRQALQREKDAWLARYSQGGDQGGQQGGRSPQQQDEHGFPEHRARDEQRLPAGPREIRPHFADRGPQGCPARYQPDMEHRLRGLNLNDDMLSRHYRPEPDSRDLGFDIGSGMSPPRRARHYPPLFMYNRNWNPYWH